MIVESYAFFNLFVRAIQCSILFIEDYSEREMTGNASPSFIHGAPGELSSCGRIIRSSKIGGHKR